MRNAILSALFAVAVAAAPVRAQALSFNQTPVTVQANVDTLYPNAQGWNISSLKQAQQITVASTLPFVFRQDDTVAITYSVEYTSDASGQTGWNELFGSTWHAGYDRNGFVREGPSFGPFETTVWPTTVKRLRIHVNPNRTITEMSWSLSAV